ncbi:MAG TPA: desulfoferrodoxin [Candidatus Cloacimonadota bacterium]|nr:desulfoferrodoxin [Candidatus Cloacimonadota bacterium]
MIALQQLYHCPICGNVVEVQYVGGGTLVCCGKEMELLNANSVDAAKEKHVPIVEGDETSVTVKVGSVPHPMLAEHYIAMVEVITSDNQVLKQELKAGMEPLAVFNIPLSKVLFAREYCNIHGLWKSV